MAKQSSKKKDTGNKQVKTDFRVVKESPASTKISKAAIENAVEKAIALTSR